MMADLTRLFELARDRSRSGRHLLADSITDIYFSREQPLSDREREIVDDILVQLVRDAETEVRRKLADRLSHEPSAPPHLILMLAEDRIEVAEPVLTHSRQLTDAQLIDLARRHGIGHRRAIAARQPLAAPVADVLAAADEPDLLVALAENHRAALSDRTLAHLTRRAREVEPLRRPLLNRPDVPVEVALELYWWVSVELRRVILDRFRIPGDILDGALSAILQEFADAARARRDTAREQDLLVDRLHETGTITPALLVQTLRLGQVGLFGSMLARRTGLDLHSIRLMIAETGGNTLAVACRSLGIEKGHFASIFLLARAARPGDQTVDPRELSRVLALYDRLKQAEAETVVAGWRRDPSYLRQLEQRMPGRFDA